MKLLCDVGAWLRSQVAAMWKALTPHPGPSATGGGVRDVVRSRRSLILENAMLRHQVAILGRKSPRPRLTTWDRLQLLLAAAVVPTWRRALAIVQPDAILRWHREGFRILRRRRTRAGTGERQICADTVTLIREMATNNRMWGAERIGSEGRHQGQQADRTEIHSGSSPAPRRRPDLATFVKNHADDIWCCDFAQTYDLLFRPLFLFFLLNQGSRKVVHIAATGNPSQEWTAQQLRNATTDGLAPRFLIRDRDEKFGASFDLAAEGVGISRRRCVPRT